MTLKRVTVTGFVGFVSALMLVGTTVSAQSATPRGAPPIKIRKLSKLSRMSVETPDLGGSSSRRPKSWERVLVQYESKPEWIDDLTMTFTLLAKTEEQGKPAYSLYRLNVRYMDVAKGKDHLAAAYLRPPAVERYGSLIAVAVEVQQGGVVVGSESQQPTNFPAEWWKDSTIVDNERVTLRDGYLLSREDTPFSFISYDDYEVIK